MKKGSLIVVGSGIKSMVQLTREAQGRISIADKVFYGVCDSLSEKQLLRLNPTAESLSVFYEEGKNRLNTYQQMINLVCSSVRKGLHVCAVFYGHPGVFVFPSHECVKILRKEGYTAKMLPGISSEDCLFADLGIDPAQYGYLSYEATELLLSDHPLDPSCTVVLWQVDAVGIGTYHAEKYNTQYISVLVEKLLKHYPATHQSFLYCASVLPLCAPRIVPIELQNLSTFISHNPGFSTLVIPPALPVSISEKMAHRLGINIKDFQYHPQISEPINKQVWRASSLTCPKEWYISISSELGSSLCTGAKPAKNWTEALKERLENHPGFAVLKGLPHTASNEELKQAFQNIASSFAELIPQDAQGNLTYDVTESSGNSIGETLPFHTDNACGTVNPNYMGLLCLQPAAKGGLIRLVNAHTLMEELIQCRPDLLPALEEDFPFIQDHLLVMGEQPRASTKILNRMGNSLIFRFLDYQMASSNLSPLQKEALHQINLLLENSRLVFETKLARGDIYFVNNHWILHGRSAYRNQPDKPRHFVRLWSSLTPFVPQPTANLN